MRKQVLACLLLGAFGGTGTGEICGGRSVEEYSRRNRVLFDEARG